MELDCGIRQNPRWFMVDVRYVRHLNRSSRLNVEAEELF